MITGDHPVTAAAIARELGLVGEVYEGRELNGLSDEATTALVERSAVFVRVAPEHKMHIVESLQRRGHVVAMTGDGLTSLRSSAPTSAWRWVSPARRSPRKLPPWCLPTTTLPPSSEQCARCKGRTIYENIVKFVRFQLSTNIGAILTVLGVPFMGLTTPFTAVQILWVNIIMDGPPAMTLGVEPARPGIMDQPPRSGDAAILSPQRLWRIALYGLTMAVGTLGVYAWAMRSGDTARAMTLAFTTFVLFQFFNIFNARTEHGSAFNRQFFSNGKLWLALLGAVLLQIVVVHWGLAQAVFDTVDLSANDWLIATAVASFTLLLEEGRKLVLGLVR